jgi:hypothetical protein
MKLLVEQCSVLDISALQRSISKDIRENYPDITQEEKLEIILHELDMFRVGEQSFNYTHKENFLGGYRWAFLCPKCNREARKLFLPPIEKSDHEHRYLCRICHNLINESNCPQTRKMYTKVFRPLRKLQEIESKLEKGYLQPSKVEALLNEYDAIEAEMKKSVEYRLYSFRKRGELRAKNDIGKNNVSKDS